MAHRYPYLTMHGSKRLTELEAIALWSLAFRVMEDPDLLETFFPSRTHTREQGSLRRGALKLRDAINTKRRVRMRKQRREARHVAR